MVAKRLLLIVVASIAFCAHAQIKNYTPINYGPKNYGVKYDAENHAIAQNRQGIMYFGTANATWEFDGQSWRRLDVKQGVWVKSIMPSVSGDTIYVGAQNEFGFLVAENSGQYSYISLSDSIRTHIFPFSDVWNIFKTDDGVYFQSHEYIFKYSDSDIVIIEPETEFHNAFFTNNSIYARQRHIGLARIDSNRVKVVTGGDIFAEIGIFGMLKIGTDTTLIISYEDGTWLMVNDSVRPNKSKLNATLKSVGFNVTGCTLIDSCTIALGSRDNGILVVKTDGTVVLHINVSNGLIDNWINNIFCDREHNIWITTQKGITLLPENSYLSVFTDENGINGSVNAICEANGTLYVGTLGGLLKQNKNLKTYTENLFVPVPEIKDGVWCIAHCNSDLLIGTEYGLYRMTANNVFERISNYDTRCISFCPEKQMLLAGGNRGLSVFEYDKEIDMWFGTLSAASGYSINSIEYDIDSLGILTAWLGTSHQGIVKFTTDGFTSNTEYLDESNGLTQGLASPVKYTGQIYFLNQGGHIFRYISKEEVALALDDSLKQYAQPLFSDAELPLINNIYMMKSFGNVTWISEGTNIACYINDDTTLYDNKFRGLSAGKINTIYTTDNRMVWIGATDGLVLCDNTSQMRRVPYFGINRGLKTTNGNVSLKSFKPRISYKDNTLTFSFAAPWFRFPESIRFQYLLNGYMTEWQESEINSITFNHLPEGTYTFNLRAVNAFGEESSIDEFTFTIRPPWYRTIVAYFVYIILAILAVICIIKYYTYQLKERNRLLDLEVKRQTKQIEEQLKKIEEQNVSLTDSINYAARIQRMSLPTTSFVENYVSESFILFKPRDIVSGDFYWCAEADNKLVITAADCTGHGVPGAMMSMLGMNSLNTIVKVRGITDPGSILNDLRASIVRSFADKGENAAKDGMDICMLTIDKNCNSLQYAGAYNSLLQIRNGELNEYKVDKFPCALSDQYKEGIMFKTNVIDMQKGDCYYFFSDGYCDQFGGENGDHKFMKARFKRLLLEICNLPMQEQGKILDNTHLAFKGTTPQIDDILVIGIRI